MLLNLGAYTFIDNHAHSLLRENRYLDINSFRHSFSESRSLEHVRTHVPNSLHYRYLLKELGRLYKQTDEQAIIGFRSEQSQEDLIGLLWNAAGIQSLIIDDGFNSSQCLSITDLASLAKRPVFLCRRIEPILEELITGCATLAEVVDLLPKYLAQDNLNQLVSLKTICGYRGGLAINVISQQEAKISFNQLKNGLKANLPLRITASPVYHYLLLHCLEIAAQYGLPVQIHTGIGDDDADLVACNPALLQPIFRSNLFAPVNFILLHCYPYVREAAFLASLYPNVFVDLSLSVSLAHSQAAILIAEALGIAPITRILAGSDGHSIPEAHWFGAMSWKHGLAQVLSQLITNSYCSEQEADWIAKRILKDNTTELYRLEINQNDKAPSSS